MKKIICLFLALIMCFGSAVSMYAEEKSKVYISDIKIGYGNDGKQKLINAGYKVNDSFNVNESGKGKYADTSVWIGFKETNNPLEAITDIAVMNMDGAYTFSGWAEQYKMIQDNIDSMYDDFAIGVKEYRENLEENSPYAIAAYNTMNYFLDMGFTDSRIGDLFADENTTPSQLKNVLMMGNYEFVKSIKQCIALACTEWKQNEDGKYDTFVERLNNNGYCTDEPDPSYNHERALVSNAISNLKPDIAEAEANRQRYYNSYSVIKDEYKLDEKDIPVGCSNEELDELQFEKYVKDQCTEEQRSEYIYFRELIKILKNVTIKPEIVNELTHEVTQARESLYDIITKDANLLKESDFETIRKSMTAGQIGVLDTVGLALLLFYESNVENESYQEEYEKKIEEIENEYGIEAISVYYGVDISIFLDPDNTALTTDAYNAMKVSEGCFGVDLDADNDKVDDTLWIAGICVTLGVWLLDGIAYGVLRYIVTHSSETFLRSSYSFMTNLTYVLVIIAIVAFVVGVILCSIAKKSDEEDNEEEANIEYTKIPKNIVAVKIAKEVGVGEQKVFYTYTCAELIDSNKNSNSTLNIYGDLNQRNGKNQWVAVYYTKNRSCGDPITSNVILKTSKERPEGYVAIHEFGMDTAADLNKFNSGENKKSIYGFIKTTTFETTENGNGDSQKMSVFSTGTTVMLTAIAFAVGAVVSGFVTYSGTKKKYKKA